MKLPLSEYILRILSTRQVLANPPQTGAELVAYWHSAGIINSRPDITDSQAYARKLRHEAEYYCTTLHTVKQVINKICNFQILLKNTVNRDIILITRMVYFIMEICAKLKIMKVFPL